MPIYEYKCSACGTSLEKIQRLSDAPLTTCPQCEQETLVKQVSSAAFQLKGTGWYATDFKNKGQPATKTDDKNKTNDAGKDSGADAAPTSNTDTKSGESVGGSKPETTN